MAKEKQGTGRVTPKGTAPRAATTSGRYTPPVPRAVKVSPRWVPVLMGSLIALGAIVILLNYVDVLPGGASNAYLLVGLALITGGFITATQWH
jgi:Cell division protein CrgA